MRQMPCYRLHSIPIQFIGVITYFAKVSSHFDEILVSLELCSHLDLSVESELSVSVSGHSSLYPSELQFLSGILNLRWVKRKVIKVHIARPKLFKRLSLS